MLNYGKIATSLRSTISQRALVVELAIIKDCNEEKKLDVIDNNSLNRAYTRKRDLSVLNF